MYKLLVCFICLSLCYSCGELKELVNRSKWNKSVYFDVAKNEIVSTNDSVLIQGIMFDQLKNDNSVYYQRINLPNASKTVEIPLLKDSIAYFDFKLSVYLTNNRWKDYYTITLTKALINRKKIIYSRFNTPLIKFGSP